MFTSKTVKNEKKTKAVNVLSFVGMIQNKNLPMSTFKNTIISGIHNTFICFFLF